MPPRKRVRALLWVAGNLQCGARPTHRISRHPDFRFTIHEGQRLPVPRSEQRFDGVSHMGPSEAARIDQRHVANTLQGHERGIVAQGAGRCDVAFAE